MLKCLSPLNLFQPEGFYTRFFFRSQSSVQLVEQSRGPIPTPLENGELGFVLIEPWCGPHRV